MSSLLRLLATMLVAHPLCAEEVVVHLAGDVSQTEMLGEDHFTVTMSPGKTRVVIPVRWTAVTATLGEDFQPIDNEIVFEPGQTTATASVRILNDLKYEGSETFTIELLPPPGYHSIRPTATFFINDDDRPPVLRVRSVSAPENSVATLAIFLEGDFEHPFVVPYSTTALTATSGADFVSSAGELTFAPGDRGRSIEVEISADETPEPTELLELTLEPPGTFALRPRIAIIDDDTPAARGLNWDAVTFENGVVRAALSGPTGSVALSAARGVRQSPVVISEIETGIDSIELENVSEAAVDLSGWRIYFYDEIKWPTPSLVYTVAQGSTLAAGAALFITEGNTPRGSAVLLGVDISWADLSPTSPIAALLTDPAGNARDFFSANGALGPQIVEPYPILDEGWRTPPRSEQFHVRHGSANSWSTNDWIAVQAAEASLGAANQYMRLPFTDAGEIAVSPNHVELTANGWSGELSVPEVAPLRLVVTDGAGRRFYSPRIEREVSNDLVLTLTQPAAYFASGPAEVKLTVENKGAAPAENVIAELLQPVQFTDFTTVLSQGTVGGASPFPVAPYNGARYRFSFGTIAPGASATMTRRFVRLPAITQPNAARDFYMGAALVSPAVDADLSNNSVMTLQELSGRYATNLASVVSWWPGELNGLDALGRNHAQLDSSVGFAPAKVGNGFKLAGAANGIVVPNDSSLNVQEGQDLLVEFWFYIDEVPVDGISELARKLPVDSASSEVGWRLWVANGSLRAWARAEGGPPVQFASGDFIRPREWHHVQMTIMHNFADTRLRLHMLGQQLTQSAPLGRRGIVNDAPLLFGSGLIGMIDEPSISIGEFPPELPNVVRAGRQGKRPIGPDENGDRIPNAWQEAAATLPAWSDADGDGLFLWEELALWTSPTDASSTLRVHTRFGETGEIELTFRLVGGRGYWVERSDVVGIGANWEPVIPRRIVTSDQEVMVRFPATTRGFFRAVVD